MTCDQAREALLGYLEGTLAAPEREEVVAHLAACATCRAEAEALRWAEAALAPLATAEVAPSPRPEETPWLAARRPARRWLWVTAAAAAVLVLAAVGTHRLRERYPSHAVRKPFGPLPVQIGKGKPHEQRATPQAESPAPPGRKNEPSAEPASFAVVVVETGEDMPSVSRYQAEVALPDGTTSAVTVSTSQDAAGGPREITLAYAERESEGRR